jgi:hypothetical protein
MLLLQAILGFLQRFLGRIVQSVFGWAVRALFGEVEESETTLLSLVIGGAAFWPFLFLGVAFPRVAMLILTLMPLPEWFPAGWMRIIWIALTALVPVAVGVALAKRGRRSGGLDPSWKIFWRGFPITLGVAAAFLIAFVASPVRKVLALLHEKKEDHVPLIVPREAYEEVAAELRGALADAGIRLDPVRPPWPARAISRTLRALGGPELRSQIPKRLAYFQGPDLEFVLYPHGASLFGTERTTARAHALVAERASRTAAFQTTDPAAQKVERRIKAAWRSLEEGTDSTNPEKPLAGILAETADLQVGFAQWQIVYREALQLAYAVRGGGEVQKRVLESEPLARTVKRSRRSRTSRRATRQTAKLPGSGR